MDDLPIDKHGGILLLRPGHVAQVSITMKNALELGVSGSKPLGDDGSHALLVFHMFRNGGTVFTKNDSIPHAAEAKHRCLIVAVEPRNGRGFDTPCRGM
ncbi:hypothetical protein HG531_004832 [Fusarium graminearum]|nr:hypothetical protein HG531_004832 [Fusarium graminearum]